MDIFKNLLCILVWTLLLPFAISFFGGLEADCKLENGFRQSYFTTKCKNTGYVYLDSFLSKIDKFLDFLLEETLIIADQLEDWFIIILNKIIRLFYVKEETFADKIYSMVEPLIQAQKPRKTFKLCPILAPYVYLGQDEIVLNKTRWHPTCLTSILLKIAMILFNPVLLFVGILFYKFFDVLQSKMVNKRCVEYKKRNLVY